MLFIINTYYIYKNLILPLIICLHYRSCSYAVVSSRSKMHKK